MKQASVSIAALIATALIACGTAACTHSEPAAPISDATPAEVVIGKGDIDAAIANARAALAELDTSKPDNAAVAADLLEGIFNEDPRLIGAALEQLAKNFPRRATAKPVRQ